MVMITYFWTKKLNIFKKEAKIQKIPKNSEIALLRNVFRIISIL